MTECENLNCGYCGGGWLISDPVCCPICKTAQTHCHCEVCEELMREIKQERGIEPISHI